MADGMRFRKIDDEWYVNFDSLIEYLERAYDKMKDTPNAGWVAFLRAMISRMNEMKPGSGGTILRRWDTGPE